MQRAGVEPSEQERWKGAEHEEFMQGAFRKVIEKEKAAKLAKQEAKELRKGLRKSSEGLRSFFRRPGARRILRRSKSMSSKGASCPEAPAGPPSTPLCEFRDSPSVVPVRRFSRRSFFSSNKGRHHNEKSTETGQSSARMANPLWAHVRRLSERGTSGIFLPHTAPPTTPGGLSDEEEGESLAPQEEIPPLMDVLANKSQEPVSLRSLLHYARRNLMDENVLFYLEVCSFKTAGGSESDYLAQVKKIYNLYIMPASVSEVNISGTIHIATSAAVDAVLHGRPANARCRLGSAADFLDSDYCYYEDSGRPVLQSAAGCLEAPQSPGTSSAWTVARKSSLARPTLEPGVGNMEECETIDGGDAAWFDEEECHDRFDRPKDLITGLLPRSFSLGCIEEVEDLELELPVGPGGGFGDRTIFDAAQREIFGVLRTDVYPKFVAAVAARRRGSFFMEICGADVCDAPLEPLLLDQFFR